MLSHLKMKGAEADFGRGIYLSINFMALEICSISPPEKTYFDRRISAVFDLFHVDSLNIENITTHYYKPILQQHLIFCAWN